MTRVALAGYGFAGRTIHAPLLAEAGCEVVAVSTRDPQRAADARTDIPGVQVVDGSSSCSPCRASTSWCSPPRAAGTPRRCARWSTPACRASSTSRWPSMPRRPRMSCGTPRRPGSPLTVFQNRRYDAEQATVARVVAEGLVGTPFRYEMRWERWRPVPKERWREQASPAEGGGLLLDLHSHLVDAAVRLFGPVATVFATVEARTTRSEDDAFLVCRHAGGVVSHLGATSLSGAPGPRVRLLGTEAAYVMADFTGETHVW